VAVIPSGMPIEEMWVENPLHALMQDRTGSTGFLLEGASAQTWGVVLRRADLQKARRACPQMSLEDSLTACGVQIRSPAPEALPFQLDEWLRQAKLAEAEGDWLAAANSYESMAERYQNEIWMKTMAARAYLEAGRHPQARRLIHRVNDQRPTIDTLLLEAKACRQAGDFRTAIQLLTRAERELGEPIMQPCTTVGQPAPM
jgi:tetratricopeptide (TPR) repeat protein